MTGGDLLYVIDVAPDLGITPGAVCEAMRKANGRRIHRIGRRGAITYTDALWLAKTRERFAPLAKTRPRGWLKGFAVADLLGVSESTVEKMMKAGKLRAVRHGWGYFYDPESVEALRRSRERLLPGWVFVADVIHDRGWTWRTAYRGVESLGLTTRVFYPVGPAPARGRKGRRAIREDDLPRLIDYMKAQRDSDMGHVAAADLAAVFGLRSSYVLQKWAREGCPHRRTRFGGYLFTPKRVRDWLRKQPGQEARAAILTDYLRGEEWKRRKNRDAGQRRAQRQRSTGSKPSSTPRTGSGRGAK